MQETPSGLLQKATKIYFDSKKAVLAESGDVIPPLKEHQIKKGDFTGEIGHVINQKIIGRENDREIIFFKTVGIAAQDLMATKSIYEKACKQNIGRKWGN